MNKPEEDPPKQRQMDLKRVILRSEWALTEEERRAQLAAHREILRNSERYGKHIKD